MAKQLLDKLKPSLLIENIPTEGNRERNSPQSKKDIQKRLRKLVNKTWRTKAIRLIAWSEEEGSWYMWNKAKKKKSL